MAGQIDNQGTAGFKATVEDVERVLAIGRLLISVLVPKELEQLRRDVCAERSRQPTPNPKESRRQVTLVSLDAESRVS